MAAIGMLDFGEVARYAAALPGGSRPPFAHILRTLDRSVGQGNYEIIVALDGPRGVELDDDF